MGKKTNVVNEYAPKHFTVQAVRWNCDNTGEILQLAKSMHVCPCVNKSPNNVIMLADQRCVIMVREDEWVVSIGDNCVWTMSDEDFRRMF